MSDYAIVADCRIYDFDLQGLYSVAGVLCDYDFDSQQILMTSDDQLVLQTFDGQLLWKVSHQQPNHDVKIDAKRRVYYSLDYELREVNGAEKGFSVLRAFDHQGQEFLHWSTYEIYDDLLNSKYRDLLLYNIVEGEVRLKSRVGDLVLLVNNIQLLEQTKLKLAFSEEGRYLVLSFANLNHLALFDLKTHKIVWRYDFFTAGEGAFFHTPQFLSSKEVLVFTNINLMAPHPGLEYLALRYDEFYSDVCRYDLDKPGVPIQCWLKDDGVKAKIMGSAEIVEDNLFVSFCGPKNDFCTLELRNLAGERLWNSQKIEEDYGLPLISKNRTYRAKLVDKKQLRSLIKRR